MRKSPTNDPFCSTREAADLLGVALRTIQVWVENGVLPAWKTAGGHRRIARSAVEQLFAQRAVVAGAPQNMHRQQARKRLNVLVVDDEAAIIRLYELQFASWGLPIDLITASNGFQGLVRIGQVEPDLLLVDLNMPDMDGFRMIQSLRGMPHGKNMEVVVVTGLGAAETRGRLPAGLRVLRKPIPFAELRRIVTAQCRKLGLSTSPAPTAAPAAPAAKPRKLAKKTAQRR